MKSRTILSRRISSLLALTTLSASGVAADVLWDGGAGDSILGNPLNWNTDVVPSVAAGDNAVWDGTVAGPLVLLYNDAAFAGAAGNPGINLSLTSGQVSSLNLDSGVNTSSLRMNGVSIASGAGAFSLGNGTDAFNLTLGGAGGQTHTWTNDSTNTAVIASDVVFGLGGGGAHTLALGGTGNWTFNNVIGQGAGTLTLSKSGAGTLTLNGANTYTGGVIMNAGTLLVNHASALGNTTTGALTINGGTIDNTSGAAITTTAAKASTWSGDFTFTGTNNLNLNNGAVTIGGTGTRTVNVANGVLSTGLINSATAGLTKTGAGTLAMTNPITTGTLSNIAGTLDVQQGKFQMSGDVTVGGLTGAGVIENGGVAAKWFFVNNAADNTFSGTIKDGAGVARLGLVKRGVGTLNLTGTGNSFTDNFDIQNGTVRMTGVNTTGTATGGLASIGSIASQSGVLIIDGGTLNATKGNSPSLAIGTVANSRGFVKMSSGAITTTSELHLGRGTAGSFSALSMTGGTVTSGSWLVVGSNNDRAIINQSGGSIVVSTNMMTIGAGGGTAGVGVVNISGGSLTATANGIMVGERGIGMMNVSGAATVAAAGNGIVIGPVTTQTGWNGTLNLLGGTVTTNRIAKGGGTGNAALTLNGATIRAGAANATFLQGLNTAHLYSGGVTFDSNGNSITVEQPLLAPTGNGLSAIAVATGGAGYIDTPVVTITGGTGTGASAIANISGGVVTGFTITNPGVNYTNGDVLTVTLAGGGATTAATAGALTYSAFASGGLTKVGNGTLVLKGASSYTGNVLVSAGTLDANIANVGNPITGALGNSTIAGRTVTVNSGATLRLVANDTFGNQTAVAANLPSLLVNGTLSTVRYNQIGALTLNGATLSSNNTTDTGNYQNFQFLGDVTVAGSTPSFISSTSAPNSDANHLGTATTFNVADVTGNANADLLASAPFRDQSGNYASAAGSLIKAGAGRMELSGSSSYTGSTTVSNGILALSGSGSINASSGIAVNTGSKLVQASSVGIVPVVSLNDGSIDGIGSIDTVNVANLATNTITAGNGAGTTLTINTLSFAGAGKLNLLTNSTTAPLFTNSLTTGAGTVTVDAVNASWTNGVYDLISYGGSGILGNGFSSFTKGTITGLGARQNAVLGDNGLAVTLTIAGDLPVWTGLQNTSWTTTPIPGAKNWKLQAGGTPTDYITNDTVVFNDTATGTTVNIAGANVSPASTTFNNTSKTYTVTGTGGFGIATGSLTKNGTGLLNLGGTHTYTGATNLTDGTTNLNGTLGNTAVTVGVAATLSLNAAGAINQNTLTVDGTLLQTASNALSGTASVILNNGASLDFSNAHSGGTKLVNGTLAINHPAALGTGLLTIAGGAIDNTSGAPVTVTNNIPQLWTSGVGLIFQGTNALNLGTGAVALGSDASTGFYTIQNNSALSGTSLTVGGPITAGAGGAAGVKTLNVEGSGDTVLSGSITVGTASSLILNNNIAGALTLSGAANSITTLNNNAAGTLTLSGAANSINTLNINGGASSIVELGTGHLTVANGGGNILQSTTGGTINATGGGGITLGSANGDFGTAGGTTLTVNAKISGTNSLDFYNANGGVLGTIILTAANDYTGGTNVENTKVIMPAGSALNANNVPNIGQITVGDVNGSVGMLNLDGGTINATKTAIPSFAVGSVANSVGVVNQTAGTINSTSELHLGRGAGGYAAQNISGGVVNVGSWYVVGLNNDRAFLNQSGGAITVLNNRMTIGAGGAGSQGVVNQTGGTLTVNAGANTGIFVGENGKGTYTLGGTGALTLNTNGGATSGTLQFGGNASSTAGNFNLNGGVATVFGVTKGASAVGGIYRFNFNGGTLKANGANAAFFSSLADTTAYVNPGGAVIDDSGFAITVAQPLLAPTGNGVSNMVATGAGYSGAPLVQIIGDGTGATAIANIDSAGNITGITITNPGVNYTTATATFLGGGGFGTVDTVDLAANTSGGFTKKGNGILTLGGANTFTGPTVIETGTLALTGSISASTAINVKSGATLNVSGVAGFTLATGQTLQGNGTVTGNVAMGVGSILAPGQSPGTLTFANALDVTGAVTPDATGALHFELGTISDRVLTNGGLAIGDGVLGFDDFTFTTVSGFSGGEFTLFDGTTAFTGSLDGTDLTGLVDGFSATLSVADNGHDIVLTVVPEPGSTMLMLGGLAMLAAKRRRRK